MAVKPDKIKIGTRGSALALTQVGIVRAALAKTAPHIETEVVEILTSGDWKPTDGEVRLNADAGGKGQFSKEIEDALLSGEIDIAVHSMKDMETVQPAGLAIPCMLPREDVRDVLLVRDGLDKPARLQDLPRGATIGTASVRRQAFLLHKRPDLNIAPLRGNVQTRIDKVRGGQVDATFLALAGLKRLGLAHEADLVLETEDFLPAAGQGAIGIECRTDDEKILAIIGQINCKKTMMCVSAERAALRILDGSCHTPIGALATLENGRMFLCVAVAAPDGSKIYEERVEADVGSVAHAEETGRELGMILKEQLPAGLLKQEVAR